MQNEVVATWSRGRRLHRNCNRRPGLTRFASGADTMPRAGFIGGDQNGDLSAYAAQSGAVIVSVSYRLGVLGFMNLDGMALAYPTPSDPAAAIPNVGLLDQQVALQWASANAAAFGADPANVLLTGQSAGGSSVLFQLTLQGSAGTFKSAIPMSPGSPVNTMAAGQATAAAIAAKLNCPSSTMNFTQQMACLRSVSSSDIVNAGIAVAGTYNLPLTLGPTIDGALVKVAPITAMLDVSNTSGGWFNTEAVVVVTETLFEGDALLVGYMHNTTFNATQAQQSLVEFGTMVGFNSSVNDGLGSLYAAIGQRDGLFNGSTRMWGDGLLACCSYWAALGASQRSTHPVYRLLWNTTLSQQYGGAQPAGRSTHGTDLPFYFESQSYFSPLEQLVQSDWYKVLINLATAADVNTGPAGQSLPLAWPAYQPNSSQPTMLVVNELRNYSLIDGWQEEFCASWLPVLP